MKTKELKFLANVNIEKPIIDFLIEMGFDVKWVADIDKQMSDTCVFEIANREQRIVLTNDKDFGAIAFLQKKLWHITSSNKRTKFLRKNNGIKKYIGKIL